MPNIFLFLAIAITMGAVALSPLLIFRLSRRYTHDSTRRLAVKVARDMARRVRDTTILMVVCDSTSYLHNEFVVVTAGNLAFISQALAGEVAMIHVKGYPHPFQISAGEKESIEMRLEAAENEYHFTLKDLR